MMGVNLLWVCTVFLLLNVQLFQASDIEIETAINKASGDGLLVHLISSVVKFAEKIKDLEYKVEKQQKKHDEELKKYAEDIEKMKSDHADDINMLKGSLVTKQPITPVVGFHVALDHHQSSGGKVTFNQILSNEGNGWNTITHTYKVPTKGLYFLILTVMNSGSSTACARLKRGSTNLQAAYASGVHPDNMGTTSTVLMLDAGEHIYAQYAAGTLHKYYTHFAGFLIQKGN